MLFPLRFVGTALVVSILLFVADLSLPMGVLGGMPYVFVMIFGWWSRPYKWVFLLAAVCTVFVIAGYLLSPFAGAIETEAVYRLVAILMIWAVAALLSFAIRTNDTLREREDLHQSIMTNAVDGILIIDENGIVQSFNAAAEEVFGYPSEEIIGKNISILMPDPYAAEHDSYLTEYFRTGMKKIIGIGREAVGLRKNGEVFPLDLAVSEICSSNQRMFAGFVRDITDRKQAEEMRTHADMLEEMVRQDALTGLLNRRGLVEVLVREAERAKRYGFPLCVHMIDLDHFKDVNDTHGHIVGDDVLMRTAEIIQLAIRGSDITARYGGEEFCIVLPQTDFSGALTFAERIHDGIVSEVYSGADDQRFSVTCSIGVAEFQPDTDDSMSLLERADQALYQAKNAGRNQICQV